MGIDGSPADLATYRRHADELSRYATVLVGPTDAADVVAEAVLSAFSASGWRDVDNRRAYLYRSVLNRALSHRRSTASRRRRETVVALSSPSIAPAASPEAELDAHKALAALSPQQRAVVHLTYWEDQTPAQIAGLLDVSEGTVRKQLARARDHLREILHG